MKKPAPDIMTKAQAKAWKARWKLANDLCLAEARRLTFDEKVEELSSLMAWARSLARPRAVPDDAAVVRKRWTRIKRPHRGR